MARQVLPIVGAAIDIYFGGNGQVGYMIGPAVGNAYCGPGDVIGAIIGPDDAEPVHTTEP